LDRIHLAENRENWQDSLRGPSASIFLKKRGISRLAEALLSSEEGITCTELFN